MEESLSRNTILPEVRGYSWSSTVVQEQLHHYLHVYKHKWLWQHNQP